MMINCQGEKLWLSEHKKEQLNSVRGGMGVWPKRDTSDGKSTWFGWNPVLCLQRLTAQCSLCLRRMMMFTKIIMRRTMLFIVHDGHDEKKAGDQCSHMEWGPKFFKMETQWGPNFE